MAYPGQSPHLRAGPPPAQQLPAGGLGAFPQPQAAAAPMLASQMMPPSNLQTSQVPITTNNVPPGAILYQVPSPSQAAVNSGFVALAPTQEQMQSHQNDPANIIGSVLPGPNAGLLSFGENLVRGLASPNATIDSAIFGVGFESMSVEFLNDKTKELIRASGQHETCHLNEPNLHKLQHLVRTLHQLNMRGLWLSLYEQTLAELGLARSIHSLIAQKSTSTADLFNGLDIIAKTLSQIKSSPVSPQTVSVLRGLLLYIGGVILQQQQQSQSPTLPAAAATQQVVSLLDLSDFSPSSSSFPTSTNSIAVQLLERVQRVPSALEWAVGLLQPSIADLSHDSWLERAISVEEGGTSTEIEYMRVLGQVPWSDLIALSIQEIKQAVLIPLQRLLALATRKNFLSLIVLIGKAVCIIGRIYPELALSCVAILTRSPWPSKAIAVPLLTRSLSWEQLSLAADDAALLFGELYQLFQTRTVRDFAALNAVGRAEHREFVINYILSTQPIALMVYQLDPSSTAARNESRNFPLIFLLVELALTSSSSSARNQQKDSLDLVKLCLEELFFISFLWRAPPNLSSTHPVTLALKQEAFSAMRLLLLGEPRALNTLIAEVGTHLPNVNPSDVTTFLSTCDHILQHSWAPDEIASGWLGYFLCRRSFGTISPHEPYELGIDSMLQTFIQGAPHAQFAPQIQQAAFAIASSVYERCNWAAASPVVLAKSLLSILASQGLVPEPWRRIAFSTILSKLGSPEQLAVRLGDQISQKLVRIDLKMEDPLAMLLQVRLALSSSQQQFREMRSLIDWGLFRRIASISSHSDVVTSLIWSGSDGIITQLFECVRREPLKEAFVQLQQLVLDALFRADPERASRVLIQEMINTLSDGGADVFGSWVTFWSYLLIPKLDLSPSSSKGSLEKVINTLVHGLFCSHANFEELSQLVKNKRPAVRDVLGAIERGNLWSAYLACWAYTPKLPPPRRADQSTPDKFMQESSLWMFKEAAMKIQEPRMALLFWERFFLLYFESVAIHADNNYFPASWREPLNAIFTQLAQSFDSSRANEKPFYHMYYAFTTWSKDVVLTTGSNLFLAQNAELLRLFVHAFPPPFPRRTTGTTVNDKNLSGNSGATSTIQVNKNALSEFAIQNQLALERLLSKESIDKLISELPPRVPFSSDISATEYARFKTYTQELTQNLRAIQAWATAPDEVSRQKITIPVIQDTNVLLQQYEDLGGEMEKLDHRHLQIMRHLWMNEPIQMSSPPRQCVDNGYDCAGPVVFTLQTSRVTQHPNVQPDLKQNREQFNKSYYTSFSVARYLAHCLSLLTDMTNLLIRRGGNGDNDDGQTRTQAVGLFFAAAPFVLHGRTPLYSPVTTHLVQRVLLPLGRRFIANRADPELQSRVYHLFLTMSKKLNLPVISVSGITSPLPPLPPSAQPKIDLLSSSSSSATFLQTQETQSTSKSIQQMHLESLSSTNDIMMTTNRAAQAPVAAVAPPQALQAQTQVINFPETRANLFPVFTPKSLLFSATTTSSSAGGLVDLMISPTSENFSSSSGIDASTYLNLLLNFLRNAPNSNLNKDEIKVLAAQFDIATAAEEIISRAPAQQAEQLFEAFELASAGSAHGCFLDMSNFLMPKLLRFGFPANVTRVIRIMLVHASPSFVPNWDLIEDSWLQPELFITIRDELPLPDDQLIAGLKLVRRVILSSAFKERIISENSKIFANGRTIESPIWTAIESFVQAALLPLRVVDIVLNTTSALVDRIWYLYRDHLVGYIQQNAQDIEMQRVESILARLPWREATVHVEVPHTVAELANAIEIHAPITRMLFCFLNWDLFAKNVKSVSSSSASASSSPVVVDLLGGFEPATPPPVSIPVPDIESKVTSYAGKNVLHFLKLFIEMHIAAPGVAPPELSARVLSVSKDPEHWFQEQNHLFDWRLVPEEEFKTVLDGSVLFRALLKAGPHQTIDPTPHVMECALLLRDIARMNGSTQAILSAMREMRGVMFQVLAAVDNENSPGRFWFLPPQEHVDAVNNIMIPMCQQFHSLQVSKANNNRSEDEHSDQAGTSKRAKNRHVYSHVVYEPIAIMLSCIRSRPGVIASWDWGEPYLADIRFFNSRTIPRSIKPAMQQPTAAQRLFSPLASAKSPSFPPEAPPSEVILKTQQQQQQLSGIISEKELIKQLDGLNDRIYGLISRFCLSADAELGLAILAHAKRGFTTGRLAVLMQIFDETLHSYFINCTADMDTSLSDETSAKALRPMQEAVRAIDPPDAPWQEIVDACASCHASLALRVLLEQQRNYIANFDEPEWLTFMLTAVGCVTRFVPMAHHEFDIFPLWFFLLEMIADPRWPTSGNVHADVRVEEIMAYWQGFCPAAQDVPTSALGWIAGVASGGIYKSKFEHIYVPQNPGPHIQLAAFACIIFLKRTLLARDKSHGVEASSAAFVQKQVDASQSLEKMLALSNQPQYKRYQQFFDDMRSLLSPTFDIVSFEAAVCNALAPIAPYLVHMLEQAKEAVLSM